MASVQEVRAFVQYGLAVLPVYKPLDDGSCTCPNGARCKSPGKHPYAPKAPNGVNSAQSDDDYVEEVWQEDLNVGVACGTISSGLMVMDIDDEEIAEKLLEPDVGLNKLTRCSTSGRGVHIWLYTTREAKGINLIRLGGGPIGELRGDGQYVVAPPSLHYSGKQYAWLNEPVEITTVEDPLKFVLDLLKKIGVEVADPEKYGNLELPDVIVFPQDVPYGLEDDAKIKSLMKGPSKIPGQKPDRSRSLFSLAHEVVEQAWARGNRMTVEAVAGVLKRVDVNPNYQKYTHRKDVDKNYLILGTIAVLNNDLKISTRIDAAPYYWDSILKELTYEEGRIRFVIANCYLRITEVLRVDSGDDDLLQTAFRVVVSNGDKEVTMVATQKDIKDHLRDLMISNCFNFTIRADRWSHLWPSAQRVSEELKCTIERNAFAYTGWIETENGPRFLVWGLEGSISATGIDTSVKYESEEEVPLSLQPYGQGLRPPQSDAERGVAYDYLKGLIESGDPRVVITVLSQVFAGPLFSLGMSTPPPLVHLVGETSSFKTSFCKAAISCFGAFLRESPPPETYKSTPLSLEKSLHRLRDMTLLIDDYVPGEGSVAGANKSNLTRLIYTYADGSARSRMTMKTYHARSLWLSTGESIWMEAPSMQARILAVWMKRNSIDREKLTELQHIVQVGQSALLGGLYISWIAKKGLNYIRSLLIREKEAAYRWVTKAAIGETHMRPVETLANLIGACQIFRAFVKDEFPGLSDQLADLAKVGFDSLVYSVKEDTTEAQNLSAYNQIVEAINAHLAAGSARLEGRRLTDEGVGLSYASVIGWVDDDFVYLNKQVTYTAWYLAVQTRAGSAPFFNWGSFLDEAKQRHQAEVSVNVQAQGKVVKVVRLPRLEVLTALEEIKEAKDA
jgi:hypothetical protein